MKRSPCKIKITKSKVDSLPFVKAGQPAAVYRDSEIPGFCLRIGERSKAFYINRRVNGKPAWIKLGLYGAITPEQARKLALQQLGLIESGINPNEEKRIESQKGKTLHEALEEYLKTNVGLGRRSIDDYRSILLRYTGDPKKYPYMNWFEKPISSISRAAFREAYAKLGEQTPSGAEHLRSALHAICAFLVEQYDGVIIPENPIKIRKEFRYRLKPRGNRIANEHLPAFFHAIHEVVKGDGTVIRDFLLFLLLNGLRRNEASCLKWKHVDLAQGYFAIPFTKNRRPHSLPISTPTAEILKRRQANEVNEYVFPDPTARGHLTDPRKQLTKVMAAMNRNVFPRKELPPLKHGYFQQEHLPGIYFTIHDLRRTFAGIARRVVGGDLTSRLLNHISGQEGASVTKRHYLGMENVEELRVPLEMISREILLIGGEPTSNKVLVAQQGTRNSSSFVTSLFV